MLKGLFILAAGILLGTIGVRYLVQPRELFRRHLEDQARFPLLARLNPLRVPALRPIGVVSVWMSGLVAVLLSMVFIIIGLGVLMGYLKLH